MPPLNRRRTPLWSSRYTEARERPRSAATRVTVSEVRSCSSFSRLSSGGWRAKYLLAAAGDLDDNLSVSFRRASISSGAHLGFSAHGLCPRGRTLRKNCWTAAAERPSRPASSLISDLL